MNIIYSFEIEIKGRPLIALVDDGEDHSFMSLAFLNQLSKRKIKVMSLSHLQPNETRGCFERFWFSVQGIKMRHPVYVTNEDEIPYIVFGRDWLTSVRAQCFREQYQDYLEIIYRQRYIQIPIYEFPLYYDPGDDVFKEQEEEITHANYHDIYVLDEKETEFFIGTAETEDKEAVATEELLIDFDDKSNDVISSCNTSIISTDIFELDNELFQQEFNQQHNYLENKLEENDDTTTCTCEEIIENGIINDSMSSENFENNDYFNLLALEPDESSENCYEMCEDFEEKFSDEQAEILIPNWIVEPEFHCQTKAELPNKKEITKKELFNLHDEFRDTKLLAPEVQRLHDENQENYSIKAAQIIADLLHENLIYSSNDEEVDLNKNSHRNFEKLCDAEIDGEKRTDLYNLEKLFELYEKYYPGDDINIE